MEKYLLYNLDIAAESAWNLISASQIAREKMIYMQESGDFHARSDYYTSRAGFPSYLIKLTISGCGKLTYDGNTYAVPAGSLFWIDCMNPQDYRTDEQVKHWRVVWLHFYGAGAKFFYELFLQQNGGKPVAAVPPGSSIYSIFHALLALDYAHAAQLSLDLRISALLNQLLSECVQVTMQSGPQMQYPQVVQDAYLYLCDNFEKHITLEDLGLRFGVSPCHMQKLFKRYIGLSPAEYLIHLRINRTKELLRTTHNSIAAISEAVGMGSQNYLSRQFKNIEGITPLAYRNQWPKLL